MRFNWKVAALIAAAVFVALFAIRFATLGPRGNVEHLGFDIDQNVSEAVSFELTRKNYASSRQKVGMPATDGQGAGSAGSPENERYEKVGTLAQVTRSFDQDRKRLNDLIAGNKAVLQLERAAGLNGGRSLQLGIGVPPDKFDAFVEAARLVGRNTSIEVVKNDKTNEYLQLKAKRATLEKARTALEELRAGGGSTQERVGVQNRLTEIEQQIQDLGVSLGEFDTQNELCTVKVSLRERVAPKPWPLRYRAWNAFQHALTDYLMLGVGFAGLMIGLWVAIAALGSVRRMVQTPGDG